MLILEKGLKLNKPNFDEWARNILHLASLGEGLEFNLRTELPEALHDAYLLGRLDEKTENE